MQIATQTRRIGSGEFAGYFRAHIITTEYNSWGARFVTRYACEVVRATRDDAQADCDTGKAEIESGQFPSAFSVSSYRHIPHGF